MGLIDTAALRAIRPRGHERTDAGAWLRRVYRQLGAKDHPGMIGDPRPEDRPMTEEEEAELLDRGRECMAEEAAKLLVCPDDRVKQAMLGLVTKLEGWHTETHKHEVTMPATAYESIFLPSGPAPALQSSSNVTGSDEKPPAKGSETPSEGDETEDED